MTKQITYSESKRRKAFDWKSFIVERIFKDDELSEKQQAEIEDRANSWVTCACGNQCRIIPRSDDGTPKDHLLEKLGLDFYYFVRHWDWASALRVLGQIEIRSAKLIAEIEKRRKGGKK